MRLRQPEHTGENRCLPCTAVNLLIAVTLSLTLGLVSLPFMLGSFGLFVGLIYLRGYLIPGTPTFTKRYFPDEVLRLFDNHPEGDTERSEIDTLDGRGDEWMEDGNIDPERLFCDIGALTDCEGEDDLCLTTDFRETWNDRIEGFHGATEQEILSATLDQHVSSEEYAVEETDLAYIVEYDGQEGFYHGRWESKAAFTADMAADQELQARVEQWGDTAIDRIRLLGGLRLFLEKCPDCDGVVTTDEEVVDSCCRSRSVLATACEECGTRLFRI